MRLFISGTIAAVVLACVLPTASEAREPAAPQAAPVDVHSTTVPAIATAASDTRARVQSSDAPADLVAELPERSVPEYGLVGVTWMRGFDDRGMTVQVRQHTSEGWSSWSGLDIETDEGEGGRDGTEPRWVGDADGVAVRVTSPTGQRPSGLAVSTIDPGTTSAETADSEPAVLRGAAAVTSAADDGSPAFTPQPTIISRAGWGATKNTYCDSPRVSNQTRGVLVHHTAGSNSYTKSQSASIVRAVQSYHMKSRDWCDIGYNFLVDKYGQIFEGRNGGIDKPVRGAHAGNEGVNEYTMGVSMMGTFTSAEPSDALKDAMVKLVGWRLGTTFHPATGTYKVAGYVLNRIAGHRNVVSTECPGQAAYEWLSASGGLRDRVEAYISGYTSAIKTEYEALGDAKTGPVYVGESGTDTQRKARFENLDMYWSSTLGTHYVGGYVRDEYNSLTAQRGVLGLPTTNLAPTSRDVVDTQRFEHGRIYRVKRTSGTKAYALWGPIAAKYRDLGEASGVLGAPQKHEIPVPKGWYRAYFTHGTLTLKTDGSVVVVTS